MTNYGPELIYLADKGLVAALPKLISPENEAWRITAAGRIFWRPTGGDDMRRVECSEAIQYEEFCRPFRGLVCPGHFSHG